MRIYEFLQTGITRDPTKTENRDNRHKPETRGQSPRLCRAPAWRLLSE
jgi:hypothetical protein